MLALVLEVVLLDRLLKVVAHQIEHNAVATPETVVRVAFYVHLSVNMLL